MPGSLVLAGSMSYTDGSNQTLKLGGGDTVDVGTYSIQNEANVGATEETLAKGDITTIGWAGFQIKSSDPNVYVEIGTSTGVYSMRVSGNSKGGEFVGPVLISATNVLVKASAAGTRLAYQFHDKKT